MNQNKRLTHKQIVKKQIYYARFLNQVMKSMVLRGCQFLVDFLKEPNQDFFNQKLLSIEMDHGPKNIYDIKTLTGNIEVKSRPRAGQFCDGLDLFCKDFTKVN